MNDMEVKTNKAQKRLVESLELRYVIYDESTREVCGSTSQGEQWVIAPKGEGAFARLLNDDSE